MRKLIDISVIISIFISIIWLFYFEDLVYPSNSKFLFIQDKINLNNNIEIECNNNIRVVMLFLYYSKEYLPYILLLIFYYKFTEFKSFYFGSIIFFISMFLISTLLLIFETTNYKELIGDPIIGYGLILIFIVALFTRKHIIKNL